MSAAMLMGAARVISKPINDIYELGKEKFKFELSKFRTVENINKVYKKISSVHKVKTIWQIDKEVSLKTFYYPPRLYIDGEPTSVNTLRKIPDEGGAVVQGIVGQGKSIFLRYLCYQETKIGSRLPIFFQLRRITDQETLHEHIVAILKSYGLDCDDKLLDFLYGSGKIVLLLDGFDEIPHQRVPKIINELELLIDRYPDMRVVVSSRPDSGIERSPKFRVYKFVPLDTSDHPKILEKLMDDRFRAEEMVNIISSSGTKIQALLTTPLMVTLLVIVYKSEQKVPAKLSDFYDNLFSMLLYRHDKSKPGYVRERRTKINERLLQQTFEAFCFLSRRAELSIFDTNSMHHLSEEAFEVMQIDCDSSDFISDITKVTNLMVEEGYKYHFIHKSVQEFHAASFLNSRPEKVISKFYKHVMGGRWYQWEQELRFLSQIDRYRFCKFYSIPMYEKFFKRFDLDLANLAIRSEDSMIKMLACYEVVDFNGSFTSEPAMDPFATFGFTECFSELSHISGIGTIKTLEDLHNVAHGQGLNAEIEIFRPHARARPGAAQNFVPLISIIRINDVLDDALKIVSRQLDLFISDYEEMVDFVKKEDKTESIIVDGLAKPAARGRRKNS